MTQEAQAQADAMTACIDRAATAFPGITKSDGAENAALENRMGETTPDNWRVSSDGSFVLEAPDRSASRRSPFLFTCAGNLKQRVVQLVEFDGVTKRPSAGQVWGY